VIERDLTLPVAATPDLDPIVAIQAFYVMAAQLSAARGMDADRPRHLNKVTNELSPPFMPVPAAPLR
jgi:glucosamine--fructose-6-phosphate aminotransferase (isomerizing)